MAINAAIYRAADFHPETSKIELQQVNFPPIIGGLQLDSLLHLVRFIGSLQGQNELHMRQSPHTLTEIGAATEVGSAAAALLLDWPRSFETMLKGVMPSKVEAMTAIKFRDIFRRFHQYLYRSFPRDDFGFLHDAFEKFVAENWTGPVRCRRGLLNTVCESTQWVSGDKAERIAHLGGKKILALVRRHHVEGFIVKQQRRSECWIRRESLDQWVASRDSKLAQYISWADAKRELGLGHVTVSAVAHAGLMRQIDGSTQYFPRGGVYFVREDLLGITHAFQRSVVPGHAGSTTGDLMTLGYAAKHYLSRDFGVPAVVRAVVDGTLAPVGLANQFPGITGYLFRSDDLRRFRSVQPGAPPGGLLNYKEAAATLRTSRVIVPALVAHGVLRVPKEFRFGFAKLIPTKEIERFAKQYMDVQILARRLRTNSAWLVPRLKQSGVRILEVPMHGGGHAYFLPPEIAVNWASSFHLH